MIGHNHAMLADCKMGQCELFGYAVQDIEPQEIQYALFVSPCIESGPKKTDVALLKTVQAYVVVSIEFTQGNEFGDMDVDELVYLGDTPQNALDLFYLDTDCFTEDAVRQEARNVGLA